MSILNETQDKIDFLFQNDPVMKNRLYECDADAIREVGSMSQAKIDPDDVIAAMDSNDPDAMRYLYQRAQRLVLLQELYKIMCYEYYKKMKDELGQPKESNTPKRNF